MTTIYDINDAYLRQVFPEKCLSDNDRRYIFLYAIGLRFSDIASLCKIHPDTVRKKLYSAAEKIIDCTSINTLRIITLIRFFFNQLRPSLIQASPLYRVPILFIISTLL